MKTLKTLIAIPLLGLLAMPVLAGHGHERADNRFERRLDRQADRIEQGIRSGELTRWEARKLYRDNKRITRMERRFSRDGHIDRKESRKLRAALERASQKIYRLKHNDHSRGPRYYHWSSRDDWSGADEWSSRDDDRKGRRERRLSVAY